MTRHRTISSSSPAIAVFVLALAVTPFTLGACDSDDEEGTDAATSGGTDATSGGSETGGSLTGCNLGYAVTNSGGKAFGEGCTSNDECVFGECFLPGAPGNITNTQFGFCTRGCDCNNDVNARIPDDQREALSCLYPAGFKDDHHVVVQCSDVTDCQGLDGRWSSCEIPDTGGVRRVCHAL